jgi:hypothetical protein
MAIIAPFTYPGGKSKSAPRIWEALGDPEMYVEPFCGSAAVLLARPLSQVPRGKRNEILNDKDGMLVNFWRAVKTDPDKVTFYADNLRSEIDLISRQNYIMVRREELAQHLLDDPDYCDPKIAGWWVWGFSMAMANKFCTTGNRPIMMIEGGTGIHKQLEEGMTVCEDYTEAISRIMHGLADRLRGVKIMCKDWQDAAELPFGSMKRGTTVGVFLDPPYAGFERMYREQKPVSQSVYEWCLEHGHDKNLRIVLAGYNGEHPLPD